MQTIAYLRISTERQELNNQRLVILDYAHRNYLQIDKFLEAKASSRKSLKERGKQEIQSKMMVTMVGLFAEIERDLISERTCEGLIASRAKGHTLGRPKGHVRSMLDGKEAVIQIFLSRNIPKASIAKIMDVSRPTLLHFISSRNL